MKHSNDVVVYYVSYYRVNYYQLLSIIGVS